LTLEFNEPSSNELEEKTKISERPIIALFDMTLQVRCVKELSAVVPTLNNENTVGKCLESLLSSKMGEILVVDGGSTDGTLEIASSFRGVEILRKVTGIARAKDLGWQIAEVFELDERLVASVKMEDFKVWATRRPRDSSLSVDRIRESLESHLWA